MTSDILRRAAARLREAAASATPGPWKVDGDLQAVKAANGITIAYDDECEMDDGRYLALMHPPVALALADLIDVALPYADMNRPESFPVYVKALAAARAILREDS